MRDQPKQDRSKAADARAAEPRTADEWLAQNRAALEASNAYVEKYGLPLARYRMF